MNDPIPHIEKSPVAKAQHLLEQYVVPNYGRLSLVPERAKGAYLWDKAGKQYLDFGGGVAVTSIGHCPEVMVKAITEQAQKLIHCSNWYQIAEQGELAQFITEKVMAESGKCFFCNSGAEANEGMIKLARKFGHAKPQADGSPRYEIITFHNSFHGRTMATISATAQQKVKDGFAPLLEGFVHLDYNDIAALKSAITPKTVAILLEPIQGEGGIHIATREFLEAAAELCRQHDLLLLMDEVQCGIGRAGHWCGWKPILGETSSVVPDAVSWAKGMGGGFPIGAVWIRNRDATPQTKLCDLLSAGSHGTTYGGNPLACAVSLAVLKEIERAQLCERSRDLGNSIQQTVRSWNSPWLTDVRGHGLLLGFEFDATKVEHCSSYLAGSVPSIFLVKKFVEAGLLTVAAGPKVVRWLPPLNVTEQEVTAALLIFQRVLRELN
jgi:acetylornithine/N-succinyldiaminopimelate aminotransferase